MLIIHNIGCLVTMHGGTRYGIEMNNPGILENAYIVIKDNKFYEIGIGDNYKKYQDALTIDAASKLVTPGLIDSHTHLVHAGSREHELKLKLEGKTYLDILNQGGGILNTVLKTRKATFEELYSQAKKSLNTMLLHGVTIVEAKSGYGLDKETEIKQLNVAKKLNNLNNMKVISTFMGAHAIPIEYKDNREKFIALIKETIDIVQMEELASFVDVFCEKGVFTIEESKNILEYAKNKGLYTKIHADEITSLGGARLAASIKATSAEHLIASKEADLDLLIKDKIIATMLPLTSFYLNNNYFNARYFIDNGGALAIATDYNPGSSPSENIQLAMQVAAIKGKLTPSEVISAVTINAAKSINLENDYGSIEVGKYANFVIFDCPNLDYLIYHFGINHVKDVYINGEKVVDNKQLRSYE